MARHIDCKQAPEKKGDPRSLEPVGFEPTSRGDFEQAFFKHNFSTVSFDKKCCRGLNEIVATPAKFGESLQKVSFAPCAGLNVIKFQICVHGAKHCKYTANAGHLAASEET